MILCEKCDYFLFPESDEDGSWSFGCRNPNVIDVFSNFCRKYKCKYYRKIKYPKLYKETKNVMYRITHLSWYYWDRRNKIDRFSLGRIKSLIQTYIEYRDFLFSLKSEKEVKFYFRCARCQDKNYNLQCQKPCLKCGEKIGIVREVEVI